MLVYLEMIDDNIWKRRIRKKTLYMTIIMCDRGLLYISRYSLYYILTFFISNGYAARHN